MCRNPKSFIRLQLGNSPVLNRKLHCSPTLGTLCCIFSARHKYIQLVSCFRFPMLVPSVFNLYGQGQTNMAVSVRITEAEKEHQHKAFQGVKIENASNLHVLRFENQQLEGKKTRINKKQVLILYFFSNCQIDTNYYLTIRQHSHIYFTGVYNNPCLLHLWYGFQYNKPSMVMNKMWPKHTAIL